MIDSILPASAFAVETFGHDDRTPLFPGEEAIVARAVDKRRREFVTGRTCARGALAALGHSPVPILQDAKGAPRWPVGVVGSITHCAGYCAAVVARATALTAVGIDAEPHAPLPDGVFEAIARPEERALPGDASVHWDRLLFCVKECTYKVWFPLTGSGLEFDEAVVSLSSDGSFTVRILVPAPAPLTGILFGRWTVRGGLLAAALSIPADLEEM